MTGLEITGYIGAAAIGISLGLMGGGGSILTVPVLVYLMGIEPILATAYSLFIVGFSALVGGISYAGKGLVSYKTGIIFSIPAFIAVYLTRLFLIPSIPDTLFTLRSISLSKNTGILLLFAFLMVFASFSMIRNKEKTNQDNRENEWKSNYKMLVFEGLMVGILAGLVGAGGGFLIIPALVLFARLPMKMAIGTSLLIIAVNSLIGFMGDVQAGEPINWLFLIIFTSIASIGIFLGTFMAHSIDGHKLKKGFGWFVFVMGALMIAKEIIFLV